LAMVLVAAVESVASEPIQDTLPLTMRDAPAVYQAPPVTKPTEAVAEKTEATTTDAKLTTNRPHASIGSNPSREMPS
jgi:hypothetical protein